MRRLLQLRSGGQRAWPQPCPLPLLRLPARAAPGHLSHSVSALTESIPCCKPPAMWTYIPLRGVSISQRGVRARFRHALHSDWSSRAFERAFKLTSLISKERAGARAARFFVRLRNRVIGRWVEQRLLGGDVQHALRGLQDRRRSRHFFGEFRPQSAKKSCGILT